MTITFNPDQGRRADVARRIRERFTADPTTYLSTSGGQWRLIHRGMPLCADGPRERAEATAQHYRLTPDARIWNGDRGEWL